MNDPFDDIRSIWFSVNMLPEPDTLHVEIARLRKQKKNRLLLWYSALIVFSVTVILYVLYTDELNSIYRSLSEFILLFTAVYLFRHAWKNITAQKKEYLLSNRDFIESISGAGIRKKYIQVREYCICTSLFLVSGFLYVLDDMLASERKLITGLALFAAAIAALWLLLKPYYEKRIVNRDLASRIEKLLKEYN